MGIDGSLDWPKLVAIQRKGSRMTLVFMVSGIAIGCITVVISLVQLPATMDTTLKGDNGERLANKSLSFDSIYLQDAK